MIKNKFLKNTTWLIVGQIIQMILQFIVGTLSARYLGPLNYGIINYVMSYITFATSVCALGLNGVIINELVNNKEKDNEILGTCILLRLIASLISSVAVVIVIYFIDNHERSIVIIALIESISIPFYAFNTINYWYQSRLQSKNSAIIQNLAYIFTASFKIYLLSSGKDIYWFAVANVVDIFLLGIFYFIGYLIQRELNKRLCLSMEIAKRILKQCFPFVLADIMIQIYQQTDKIMIKQLLDSTEQVGMYAAVTKICSLFGFIPIAILDSGRPIVMRLKKVNESLYRIRIKQLFAVLIWFNIVYALIVTIFSRLIIWIIYGNAYLNATMCLKIAVWYTLFSYLGSARSTWLICEGKNKYAITFSTIGAFANIIINVLLIPKYGINGAAIATLVTQFLCNVGIPSIFKETRQYFYDVVDAFLLRNINLNSLITNILHSLKTRKL